MSLIAVACARGSRGATTATLALAAGWPASALVAECDPAGGSLAARFSMNQLPGMLSLASSARNGLDPATVGSHVQALPVRLSALLGPSAGEQALGLARLWPTVAPGLARCGVDVLADRGRVTAQPPAQELLRAADLTVFLAEPTADALEQLKDRLLALSPVLPRPPLVILRGDGAYPPGEVRSWLHQQQVPVEVLGTLANDGRGASLLAGVAGGRGQLARSLLLRSARGLAESLHARAEQLQRTQSNGRPVQPPSGTSRAVSDQGAGNQ